MKFEELLAKEKDTPVLCVDGIVGMLVHYPSESAPASPAGVQVPGETEVRWIAQQELHRAGAALRQQGSPTEPQSSRYLSDDDATTLARVMLGDLWKISQPQTKAGPGSFGDLLPAAKPNLGT
jgi:hypothetical protein